MNGKIISFFDRAIEYLFYILFFFTPLVVFPQTFELFEFNKMWLVFGITLLIGFFWVAKIIAKGKIEIRRTPLDILILLFLASQFLSTIFSIDPHVSIWGYYSRFNGGLLSIITYIFLYYAFASNLIKNQEGKNAFYSFRILFVSLLSGAAVALWGLPSHFAHDPTCLVFRGSFDVSCWTDAFHPEVRMFSTLGQPNWLATYLIVLLPISIINSINSLKNFQFSTFLGLASPHGAGNFQFKKLLPSIFYLLLSILFYLDLLYSRSQSGFLGFWIGIIILAVVFALLKIRDEKMKLANIIKNQTVKLILSTIAFFIVLNFFIGVPVAQIDRFSFQSIKNSIQKPVTTKAAEVKQAPPQGELGGTDSSKIRLIVWRGAVEVFKQNPVFGSGVETFAYAYYKVRPVEHNLVSEWDYLYNKAHNEYLNYLATTGLFGFASYLSIIFYFLYIGYKAVIKNGKDRFLLLALLSSFIGILISNFFGFSVVIVNLYLFIIPILFFDIAGIMSKTKIISFEFMKFDSENLVPVKMILISIIGIILLFFEIQLIRIWMADQKYAMGYNLDKAQEYTQAYIPLTEAVKANPNEDLYKDELSVNLATLAYLFSKQDPTSSQPAIFAQEAKKLSDKVVENHPNNVVFFKTRTRVFYLLSQLDNKEIDTAIDAITKASKLAPTDAKILYNMALLYGQKGDEDKAIEILKKTISIKPNYPDAYLAIALYYNQRSQKETDYAMKNELKQEAIKNLEFMLKNVSPDNPQAKELLKSLR